MVQSRWFSRLLPLLCLVACALLCFAQACDRTPKQPTTDPADVADASSDQPSVTSPPVAKVLEVKDIGPAAPTLFVLNGLKGYTEPCGCTLDVMAGGIDRVTGYIQARAKMAPGHVVIDGGNIWFEEREVRESREAQERLKADLLAKAYKELGVTHSVPGPNDFALGVKTFESLSAKAGITPSAINLSIEDRELEGVVVKDIAGVKTGLIFAVAPEQFEGVEGVKASPVNPALELAVKAAKEQGAQALVLLFQGQLKQAKQLVSDVPGIDFVMAGAKAEETDRVDTLGSTHAMQVFDQGRYVGVLKLYASESKDPFVNARTGSKAELESVARQIDYVDKNINKLPPAAPGEESPMLLRLRQRLDKLKHEERAIKNAAVEVPESSNAFVWQSVRMDEGFPENDEIQKARDVMNKEIKRVNASQDFEVVPVKDGEPFYVGNAQCKTCHAEAYAFWEKTNHSHALQTLIDKDKEYDQTCVSCHVVGFEKPGGSVLGKLEYDIKLGEAQLPVHKDLRNVGCENCHGPGSAHVEAAMFGKTGDPKQWINNNIDETTCMQSCHVPEHSPRFNFDVYIEQITGEGHARRSAQ